MLTVNAASGFGSGGPSAYAIKNSCTFNGSNEYMTRTWSASPTSAGIWSFSCWIERDGLGVADGLFGPVISSSRNGQILVTTDNELDVYTDNAATYFWRKTSDTIGTSWIHIFVTCTAIPNPPLHIYLNGTEASYNGDTDQGGTGMAINFASAVHDVGRETSGADSYMSGQMAEVVFIDGSVVAVSSFYDGGSPVDPSGLTFGDDGFHLNFQDSSDMGKDVSGNGNDFTLTNIDSGNQSTNVP